MKTLFYNAGIITREGQHAFKVVRDLSKFNQKIQIKNPGGMQEDCDEDFDNWYHQIEKLLEIASFSEEQVTAILYFEELEFEINEKSRGKTEYGVIREILEETGLYAFKIKHLHFEFKKANPTKKGDCNVNQNFFFVEEYIAPINNGNKKFEFSDKDIKGTAWISALELLSDEDGSEKILYSHKEAVKKGFELGQFSREITIDDIYQ